MDRSGRIGEEKREMKPKPEPPRSGGGEAEPAPVESLRPRGNANPSDTHPPEEPAKTTPS